MAEVKRYTTPPFRVSFPELWEAKAFDGGKPKYGLSAVWTLTDFTDNDKKLWKTLMGALNEASLERFKKPLKELPVNIRRGIRDGAEKAELEGYGAGKRFANLTTMMRPGVVSNKTGEDGKFLPIGPEHGNTEMIYPGCYCRATVTVYSYDNKGKGVSVGLMNLQFIKDGERLDSRTDAADDFADDIDEAWMDQDEEAVSAEDDFLD